MNIDNHFDPTTGISIAQFAKPPELSSINLRVLTPFQRALLVIDGTVTKFIESYTLEPVKIRRVSQTTVPLSEDHPWLEAPKDTPVALRRVLIEGEYSRTPYVHAVSLIVLERLPTAARRRLEEEDEGLGRILNDQEMETRREVLWYGKEHATDLTAVDVGRSADGFLTRTYRIITDRRPIALITEKFPADIEGTPSHH